MMHADQVTGPVAVHGEGPVWDDAGGRLRFVDMGTDAVLALDGSELERFPQPETVTVMRPRRTGGWVYGTRTGFALVGPLGDWERTVRVWCDPDLRMNDGACDPAGRFYSGSMSKRFTPAAGTMHRLDPDLSVTPVLAGLTIPNGLCWDPAGEFAYFADSPARTIDVLRFDEAGAVVDRGTLVDLTDHQPMPDGLTVDAEGGIWVAMYGAGEVRRYEPNGMLSLVVGIGVPKPTACTFGGPGYDQLFVTTTQEDLDLAEHPSSGAVFQLRIDGIRGLPALAFAG